MDQKLRKQMGLLIKANDALKKNAKNINNIRTQVLNDFREGNLPQDLVQTHFENSVN